MMRTNLDAVMRCSKAVAPHLVRRKGAIVNISSVCSRRPYLNIIAYCVSKAGLDMLTRCCAAELAPKGVRVNAVNPGVVVTELHDQAAAVQDYESFLERGKETHPLGRVGQPDEVAAMCAYLCSDEAGWVTGGIFPIDGGRELVSPR